MSKKAIQFVKECLSTKNPHLDLGNCGLTDEDVAEGTELDKLLRQCTHLEKLILSNEWYECQKERWERKESNNKSKKNAFATRPPALPTLTGLLYLACGGIDGDKWKLRQMDFVASMPKLEQLYLGYNQIMQMQGLENLNSLQSLSLYNNQITQIQGLENLNSLQSLDLSDNQITQIQGLEKLNSLQSLDLSGNQITQIQGLENLNSLQTLYLSDNQITQIQGLDNLNSLQSLSLYNNQITQIQGLENLNSLQSLDLSSNQITQIQGLDNLNSLQELYLNNNQITNLFPLLPFFTRNCLLSFSNNPLTTPPMEIAQQGREAILRYFNEQRETSYEAKILIVGEPEAGKTSLMKKMINREYIIPDDGQQSTIGIQVVKWEINMGNLPKPVQVNIWDFGGQEMQYLTHQFFLSADALYILLTSARKDHDNFDYWFNIISLLGKNENNENSELLVVSNERNMQEGQVAKTFDQLKYRDMYPHLPFDFLPVNLATAADEDGRFTTLLHNIKKKLIGVKVLGRKLPIKWGIVRDQFTHSGANYLPMPDYFQQCENAGIDEKLALDLAAYLHKIGQAVYFQNDHTVNSIILNPKWAVDGVYSILKTKEIEENEGNFTRQQVFNILDKAGYSFLEQGLLLGLMTKDSFEVAYKIPNKADEYIAPQLLPIVQPEVEWSRTGALHFQYLYPFMPKGIITRLIVRLHEAIKYENGKGLVWPSGVYFEKNGCTAKVEEIKKPDTGQQVIAIEVQGHAANRKLLLYDICRTIEGIHKDSFANIKFTRQIPCNCDFCKEQAQPHFYNYETLLEYISEDISTIRCEKKVKNQPTIKNLLQDIFDIDLTQMYKPEFGKDIGKVRIAKTQMQADPFGVNISSKKKKKIFISYSHQDEIWKNKLTTNLAVLKRQELVEEWNDRKLQAGEWKAQIETAMENADIFLLIITHNFLSSEYINSKEITTAYSKFKDGKAIIFPIICDSCDWELCPLSTTAPKEIHPTLNKEIYPWLGQLQAFPKDAKPIKKFRPQQDGFMDVINQLKKYL